MHGWTPLYVFIRGRHGAMAAVPPPNHGRLDGGMLQSQCWPMALASSRGSTLTAPRWLLTRCRHPGVFACNEPGPIGRRWNCSIFRQNRPIWHLTWPGAPWSGGGALATMALPIFFYLASDPAQQTVKVPGPFVTTTQGVYVLACGCNPVVEYLFAWFCFIIYAYHSMFGEYNVIVIYPRSVTVMLLFCVIVTVWLCELCSWKG